VYYRRSAFCCALLWPNALNAQDIHKKMFRFYSVKCVSRKAAHNRFDKLSQGRSKFTDDDRPCRRWLRQQSKDVYAAGFEALIKRWDKCINVGEGYVEKLMFFYCRISYVLRFIHICDLLTGSFSYLIKYFYILQQYHRASNREKKMCILM
jgi:hypothetical protein